MADDPSTLPSPRGNSSTRASRARAVQRRSKEDREAFAAQEADRRKKLAAEQALKTRGVARGGRAVNRGARGSTTFGGAGAARYASTSDGGIFGGGGDAKNKARDRFEGVEDRVDGHETSGEHGAEAGDVKADGEVEKAEVGAGTGTGTTAAKKRTTKAAAKKTATAEGTTAPQETQEPLIEELDDAPKRDIERIWISSGSGSDEDIATSTTVKGKGTATAKRKSRAGLGLRPVRAPRMLREEEEAHNAHSTARRKNVSTRSNNDPQEISSDERDGANETMDIDSDAPQFLTKTKSSSPESTRRKPLPSSKKPPLTATNKPLKALANETIEEKAERLRVQEDIATLHDLFVTPAQQDDKAVEDAAPGNLFLFQLPPLTPFLHDPNAHASSPPIKPDPLPHPPSATTAAKPTTIDLDTLPDAPSSTDIKPDPATIPQPPPQFLTASHPDRLPGGIVGKLHVHRSGKVTMDWGGTDMEVRLGAEVDFLQDVVLVEPAPPSPQVDDDQDMDMNRGGGGEREGDRRGKAYALGQVRHKVVCIPDWARLYD